MPSGEHPSPLAAVLAVAFLDSVGTGIVVNGAFFLARANFGFSTEQNFALAMVFGASTVPTSFMSGRLIDGLRRWWSARSILIGLHLVLAGLCVVPAATGSASAFWAFVLAYGLSTGLLWPMVESYVSGGRHGPGLRAATGRFNIVWAGAVCLTVVAIGPFVQGHARGLIAVLGLVHLAAIGALAWHRKEPGAHGHDDPVRCPPAYPRLLSVFRILLPTSYVVISTLSPFLPTLVETLGIAPPWRTPAAAVWLGARLVTFVVLERWHGWHGRWGAVHAGGVLLVAGFGMVVLSPLPGPAGLWMFLAGLAAFGVGAGVVYTSALYYAMAVGNAMVHAGGKHEALIGLGYTTGPAAGLAVTFAVGTMGWHESTLEPALFGVVATIATLAAIGAFARTRRPVHAPG